MRLSRLNACRRQANQDGVALILVMLLMLVLSLLAATLVFTARSETFASLSYRQDTEADYVAKAGIQAAVNWFRSSHYQAVPDNQATTYYNAIQGSPPWQLKTSNTSPVQCVNSSLSKCKKPNNQVQLISYGTDTTVYPADLLNTLAPPVLVTTDFTNSLQNVSVTTGSSGNSGVFCVNAYLLNYQTVNCPSCVVTPAPMETWLVTSEGVWGGTSCAAGGTATAEEQAIVQPVFSPNWGNSLYGFCSVSMWGSSGVCTDSFNSALGAYGGGNLSVAAGACDSASVNVIDSGAGVGANGFVSLSSNVTISGNVTIGNVGYTPPSSCCTTCGYSGGGSVLGSVLNAPPVPLPPVPTFPGSGQPGITFPTGPPTAPSVSSGTWPENGLGNYPGYPGAPVATNPPLTTYTGPCMTLTVCNGTKANPYLVSALSGTTTLVGGTDIGHPVYYDLDAFSQSGSGILTVNGFVVINVRTSFSLTGNGIANPLTTMPEAVLINVACSGACVSLGGNGATSSIITAPNATVDLGGGGSKGYMVGAVRAATVNVHGGYPIHYDVQLNRLEGVMGQIVVTSYSRIKQ
jgi:Tfp pilus assembly protein PilX